MKVLNLPRFALPLCVGKGNIMRKLLFWSIAIAIFSLVAAACESKEETPCEAAEKYYACLMKGDVEGYMRGMADYDSLEEEYRLQLRDMFLQYLDNEKQQRQGIVGAKAIRDTLINGNRAEVFVQLSYGNNTAEQVSVPLLLTDKGWKMR